MLENVVKYLRNNLVGLLIAAGVVFITYSVFIKSPGEGAKEIAFGILYCVMAYFGYQKSKVKKAQLKQRGLTNEDLANIDFVKDWEVKRKRKIMQYCLIDGGIILGMMLLIPASFAALLIVAMPSGNFPSLTAMMLFVLIAGSLSYGAGALLNYFRWKHNEQRFLRVTDPLNNLTD